MKKHYLWEN